MRTATSGTPATPRLIGMVDEDGEVTIQMPIRRRRIAHDRVSSRRALFFTVQRAISSASRSKRRAQHQADRGATSNSRPTACASTPRDPYSTSSTATRSAASIRRRWSSGSTAAGEGGAAAPHRDRQDDTVWYGLRARLPRHLDRRRESPEFHPRGAESMPYAIDSPRRRRLVRRNGDDQKNCVRFNPETKKFLTGRCPRRRTVRNMTSTRAESLAAESGVQARARPDHRRKSTRSSYSDHEEPSTKTNTKKIMLESSSCVLGVFVSWCPVKAAVEGVRAAGCPR